MKARHICIFICSIIAMMALLSWGFPDKSIVVGSTTLRWPSLQQVLTTSEPDSSSSPDVSEPDSSSSPDASVSTPAISDSLPTVDRRSNAPLSRGEATVIDWIDPLRQALAQADSSVVRVVHFGDSQLEGDRLSMNVRRHLQSQYGGGGVGIVPLHQTIGTRTIHQTLTMNGEAQSTGGGPKRYLVYGPKKNRRTTNVYGPMGQVAVMNDSLCPGSEHLTLALSPMSNEHQTERYFNRVRVLSSSSIAVNVRGAKRLENGLYQLPDSSVRCTIDFNGKGDVYGISLEQQHGVVVDNIPMRGCAGTIFTGIRKQEMQDFFAATNTRLIILQYGGNVVPYTADESKMNAYIQRLRAQVRYMKSCAPESAILFIGPSDMLTSINGQKTTYPIIPKMDAALQDMANEEHIGYWSLFKAMGGKGGMLRWQQQGLAGSDGVHFTRKGADTAGEKLAQFIEDELAK